MKKILIGVLMAMVVSLFVVPVTYANVTVERQRDEKNLIELEELMNMAENGISDESKIKKIFSTELNSTNNGFEVISSRTTVKKISSTVLRDGSVEEEYIAANFVTLGSPEIYYRQKWDPTISIQYAITVNYKYRYTEYGGSVYELYDIESVAGTILQHVDSQVRRESMQIHQKNWGPTFYDANPTNPLGLDGINQTYTKLYPNVGITYRKYDPQSNIYYNVAPMGAYVGARVIVNLSRGNDEWSDQVTFEEGGLGGGSPW